jgi:hypothetical protein
VVVKLRACSRILSTHSKRSRHVNQRLGGEFGESDSDTRYSQAGIYHPTIAELLPLVFWSDDRTAAAIGHVAVYLGNNQVVQAPYSGAYLEITPLDQVESGYYGATRPLT